MKRPLALSPKANVREGLRDEDLLFLQVADDLMAILGLVLATRDVNPEIKVIAGLDDGLIKVRVSNQELKPTIENVLVRVGFVILPLGVGCLGNPRTSCRHY